MEKNNWRIPTEEEKNTAIFWIKKYKKNIGISGVCASFGLFLVFIIIEVVKSLITQKISYFFLIFLVLFFAVICGINLINLFACNELLNTVSNGNYMITDARIIGDSPYSPKLMDVSYFENDELKRKDFLIYCSELSNAKVGEEGFIVNIKYSKSKKITYMLGNYFFIPGFDINNIKE